MMNPNEKPADELEKTGAPQRKPYVRPDLDVYGTLDELTGSIFGPPIDAGFTGNQVVS